MINYKILKKYKALSFKKLSRKKSKNFIFFILAGCGGNAEKSNLIIENSVTFVSPQISYGLENAGQLIDPYWLKAIQTEQSTHNGIINVLNSSGGNFKYTFPLTPPQYLQNATDLQNWTPVTEEVKTASRDIFNNLSNILNIQFVEASSPYGNSVIAIMANKQQNTTGYAYGPLDVIFPTDNYLFSDVFFDLDYMNPTSNGTRTNFDYELLVHELGHTIGLRHPFLQNTGDGTLLNPLEENNRWTVMTYNFDENNFDGQFRILDLASLVNLYGVSPQYFPEDNVYEFQSWQGRILIDGSGVDTITAENYLSHVYLDLRNNTHSYVGKKDELITKAYQLSVGDSIIENAIGGKGNDWIIGNDVNNVLEGRFGNDVLYGGEGLDKITGGKGNDTIDLTELNFVKDQVIFEDEISSNGKDEIINFKQGISGDVLKINTFSADDFLIQYLMPNQENSVDISGKISLWNFQKLPNLDNLKNSLTDNNDFSYLNLDSGSSAIAILSESEMKGKDQHIFYLQKMDTSISLYELAIIKGEELGLNEWTDYNFI